MNNYALDYSGADHVGVYRMSRNKLKTIITYKNIKRFKGLKTHEDFLDEVRRFASDNERKKSAPEKAAALWFMERLIREARALDIDASLLTDPTVERYKAVLHVGWGMHVLSEAGFDFAHFTSIINNAADPKYRLLAMEPVGVLYIAAQQPVRSFIIGIDSPRFPDPQGLAEFFGRFSEAETRISSHGFGRGSFFQAYSLCAALRKVLNHNTFFNPLYSIRGTAFAFTLVNTSHLDRVFLTADKLSCNNVGCEEADFFSQGVVSALSFLEWNMPGLLETLKKNSYTEQVEETVQSYHTNGGVYTL